MNKKGKQNYFLFDVYKINSDLYISKIICDNYNIGSKNDNKTIKYNVCYKITENDIKYIEEKSKESHIILVPNYTTVFDLKLVLTFKIYVDKTNNKMYIPNHICTKYHIKPISKIIINHITYVNITESDIEQIERINKDEKILLKKEYIDLPNEKELVQSNKIHTYYHNILNKTIYIDRQLLEIARKNNIELNAKPIIYDNKNYYEIDEDTIKEIQKKAKIQTIERIININNNSNKPTSTIVYKDCNTNKYYIPNEKSNNNCITLLNKKCSETTIQELENTYGEKFIIVDLYPRKKEMNIIICKAYDQSFIKEDILNKLDIKTNSNKKILINKEIYSEVNNNEIKQIIDKDSEYLVINITYKNIVPVNN